MEQQEFDAVSNLLRGINSSGNLNASDLSILQNAILSVFSGTYRQPQVGKSTDELIMDYAPDLFGAVDSGDKTRQEIASMVMNGLDPLTIKVKVRKLVNLLPTNEDMPLVDEYIGLVDTYKNQWQEFQKQERRNETDKREADPFVKNGLPAFDERYKAEDVYADQFQRLASDYAKNPYKSKMKKYPPGQKPSGEVLPSTSTKPIKSSSKTASSKELSQVDNDMKFRGDELRSATAAFEKFKKNNPDTFDMEYQSLLDRVTNAQKNYAQNVDSSVGFLGESNTKRYKTADEVGAEAINNMPTTAGTPSKKVNLLKTGQFDESKARLASSTPERMARVAAAMLATLQSRVDASGSTPLKDALIQNSIFAAAANKPKASKANEKRYTVKGSNVVKLGK